MWKRFRIVVLTVLSLNFVFGFGFHGLIQPAYAADSYDDLRIKWKDFLTGGSYSLSDPDVADLITEITDNAQGYWSTMDTSPTRVYLWSDLDDTGAVNSTKSSNMSVNYNRLEAMALAYATSGSSLYQDSSLLGDLISALDWMHANKYNAGSTEIGNWFDWEIGTPLKLNDITVLLYDQLTAAQIDNYMDAIEAFNPTVTLSGANRVWESTVIAIRGIIVKDSAKIAAARDGLTAVFAYVPTIGDGFYTDGSFVQHGRFAYTGGYGAALISNIANIVNLLNGSAWEVTTAGLQHMFQWVYDSFEPLLYKGAMMDMSRGRNMSRRSSQDHSAGGGVAQSVIQIAQFAPSADAANFKSMVKYWIQSDTFRPMLDNMRSIYHLTLAKAIVADSSIVPRGEPLGYYSFPMMDRAVQRRPDFAFALSMSSKRIYNYESLNNENLKGWYTGDGMTYLYNGDLGQYSDEYWGLVNPYRLPGTTVDTRTRADKDGNTYLSSKNWVGGATAAGIYGAAGMELDAYGSTLTARKSWFSFADKIVALGAGIHSTDGNVIETIVDNRKINEDGDNALTVNGSAKSSSLGWSETMSGVSRIHLQGNAADSDIGYYFPGGTTVKGLREARTGSWESVNKYVKLKDSTILTRNFLTLWFDHGANPVNGDYSYVILPNVTSAELDDYASHPDVDILENTDEAQAVRDRSVHTTGFNFWNAASKTVYDGGDPVLTSSTKASVVMVEQEDELEIGAADPTQANSGTIQLEINQAAASLISADPGVTVVQLQPTIQLSVNVSGARGKTFHAKFERAENVLLSDSFDANTTGAAPSGWTIDTSGGTVDIADDPSSVNKSMKLSDTSSASRVSALHSFTASSSAVTAEFKVKLETTSSLYYMTLKSGSAEAIRLRTFLGQLQVYNGGTYTDLQGYSPSTWYTIKIAADPATDLADIYIDGVLVQSQGAFAGAVSDIDSILFATHSSGINMTMKLDDIEITN
ncbi:polysaccharide lyase 8 family protein [Paenibacillus sp. HB172176]|uniref:polysaccharide lyase 8 family protein n=1 Tax=Paenibacillus sp. HB172176 TaxID=2493690 RepID=UPI0014393917|nr:polysaccharide lyase 8 family protein [Paenibacillus sp. HB172176]